MSDTTFELTEKLGARYDHALIEVTLTGDSVVDNATGRVSALQSAPRTGFDSNDNVGPVTLAQFDVAPGQTLALRSAAANTSAAQLQSIDLLSEGDRIVIVNGDRSVMLPLEGLSVAPYPGPIAGLRLGDGDWYGSSVLAGAASYGHVTNTIDSAGPCFVQWRTVYRWGKNVHTFVARWAAESDTLLIDEQAAQDTDAAIEWYPFGSKEAQAYHRGGGEGMGPMAPVPSPMTPGPSPSGPSPSGSSPTSSSPTSSSPSLGSSGQSPSGSLRLATSPKGEVPSLVQDDVNPMRGRRILNWLSHISYFNQWNLSWCGFAAGGDERFAGIFSGWSHRWVRRGYMRPEIIEDDDRGHLIRLPIKRGRRLWGLTFTSRSEAGVPVQASAPGALRASPSPPGAPPTRLALVSSPNWEDAGPVIVGRNILNRRKTLLSDLSLAKTSQWDLDPQVEPREMRLLPEEDVAGFRERLALDPSISGALDRFLAAATPRMGAVTAAAIWKGDEALMRRCIESSVEWARMTLADMIDGGYERVIIFDGRNAKKLAFDIDSLWRLGVLGDSDYREMRKAMLALAYIFVDPDYCRYEDFWHAYDAPDEGVALAMRDDMGDCPVPPNFISEFFTTTAVAAELYPSQREHAGWRAVTLKLMDRFLERFFESDGTYLESVNYHNHGFNEMLCQLYVQQINGVRDWTSDRKVRGSFEHFVQIRLPEVGNATAPTDPASGRLAEPQRALRSPLPANGNSGSVGNEQEYGGQLTLGAWLYRSRDPQLAGELMAAWRENGKPLLDIDHAILTLVTLDPSIESRPAKAGSVHRKSLGVVSRATRPDGTPIWALFRCGHCTHHMDFDQGALHLAAFDRVLLGDHGYHTHDNDGGRVSGANTWIHSTVVLSHDRWNSSGYTGLEEAPEPKLIHLAADFDYVVHTIVNDNFRVLNRLTYRDLLPTATTVHTRHYLFVKPDYFVLWDTFEGPSADSLRLDPLRLEDSVPPLKGRTQEGAGSDGTTFWLHPHEPVAALGAGAFRAGEPGKPNLRIQFVLPAEPDVVVSEQFGPMWSFGVKQDAGAQYLTVLHPQRDPSSLTVTLADDGRTLRIASETFSDEITLPPPASTELPTITRRGAP